MQATRPSSTSVVEPLSGAPSDDAACADILAQLRDLETLPVDSWWEAFSAPQWPSLFRLLTLAADLPPFADHGPLREPPADFWPQLAAVSADMLRLQRMVQAPTVPTQTRHMTSSSASSPEAREELHSSHCATVEDLLDGTRRHQLDQLINRLRPAKEGTWGTLERAESPDLFALFDQALARSAFADLTGYQAQRDTYTLTLSLQALQPEGIGWHQDLYWPQEWVGEDVFAVLYGLSEDTVSKGGAFLYYVPWQNEMRAIYRQPHQATILWNARQPRGRLLHAVSRYSGDDSSRHLIILQCLRRRSSTDS